MLIQHPFLIRAISVEADNAMAAAAKEAAAAKKVTDVADAAVWLAQTLK